MLPPTQMMVQTAIQWGFFIIRTMNPVKILFLFYILNYIFWTIVKFCLIFGCLYLGFLLVQKKIEQRKEKKEEQRKEKKEQKEETKKEEPKVPLKELCGQLTRKKTKCQNNKLTCPYHSWVTIKPERIGDPEIEFTD